MQLIPTNDDLDPEDTPPSWQEWQSKFKWGVSGCMQVLNLITKDITNGFCVLLSGSESQFWCKRFMAYLISGLAIVAAIASVVILTILVGLISVPLELLPVAMFGSVTDALISETTRNEINIAAITAACYLGRDQSCNGLVLDDESLRYINFNA